ncbi:cysteine-rich secretory protein 2 [Echinops telfairi]|uniref:Cysteine-rich secretory protein 2 n=1 Tax=Echinops telfairi TaxID=9371 RepID=A0ABM0IBV7_ECHTE|nr:cysteine-rich secretory protein 2 [Echinops telfairi]
MEPEKISFLDKTGTELASKSTVFQAMTLLLEMLLLVAVMIPVLPAGEPEPELADVLTTLLHVQNEIVNKHNELRRNVTPTASNMLKMQWDNKAAANAQKWANVCKFEHSEKWMRKTDSQCGENLYVANFFPLWENVVQAWYDEVKDFVPGVGPVSSTAIVGHFTQVVWYSSSKVGCGVAECPDLGILYVCQYCPGGNHVNRLYRPYDQGIPCASCPNDCDKGLCTNSCSEEEDKFSNCQDLKRQWTCSHQFVSDNCKSSCNCIGKIY